MHATERNRVASIRVGLKQLHLHLDGMRAHSRQRLQLAFFMNVLCALRRYIGRQENLPGMYRCCCGPFKGQYQPRLKPFMNARPFTNPGVAKKVSAECPLLARWLSFVENMPLYPSRKCSRCFVVSVDLVAHEEPMVVQVKMHADEGYHACMCSGVRSPQEQGPVLKS